MLVLAYQFMAWHIPPLIPFSTLNNISTSVSNSNFTSVFFKHACHANRSVGKNKQNQAHRILCACFRSFQIHLPIVVYQLARINHDTVLGFVFQNLTRNVLCTLHKKWNFPLRICSVSVYRARFIDVSIIKLSVFWNLYLTHFDNFHDSLYIQMLVCCLLLLCIQDQTCKFCICLCGVPDLIVSSTQIFYYPPYSSFDLH